MSYMSYCLFENFNNDLNEFIDHYESFNIEEVSTREAQSLLKTLNKLEEFYLSIDIPKEINSISDYLNNSKE